MRRVHVRRSQGSTCVMHGVLPIILSAVASLDAGSDGTVPVPQETTDGPTEPTMGEGLWVQDCDIRVKDANSSRDTLTLTYQPDTSAETVTVTLNCTRDLDLGHATLGQPAKLAKNTPYQITLSELKKNVTAKLAITPGILPTATEFLTHGAAADTADTSTAKVYAVPYDDAMVLWVSMNERSTPFWLQIQDVDVVVQESVASSKHVLQVDYLADTTNEEIRAEVKSNKPIVLHHPNLASAVSLTANVTYTVTLSNVVPDQAAQLEISSSILAKEDCATDGAYKSTSNGAVRVYPYASDAVVVWMSLNGKSTSFVLGAP